MEDRIPRGAFSYWAAAITLAAGIVQGVNLSAQAPPAALPVVLLATSAATLVASALLSLSRTSQLTAWFALVANLFAFVVWIVAHRLGLPGDNTIWVPETLGFPDFFLPGMDALAAFLCLCLLARMADVPPRLRSFLVRLPWLALAALVFWIVLNFRLAQLLTAIVILDANVPESLFILFVPALIVFLVVLLARTISPRFRARTPHAMRSGVALLFGLLILNLFLAGALGSARDTAWLSRDTPAQVPARSQKTLAYCWRGGSPLAMDLAEPDRTNGSAPAVFFIHGGETLLGSRRLWDGTPDGRYFADLRSDLLKRGFAVGSIDYVLAPFFPRGDEVKEAKCAVRFLRARARDLNIDPKRIGVFGPSQGGYVAAMLGVAAKGYEGGDYADRSSAVEAVVDMWGPIDLLDFSGSPNWVSAFTRGNSAANLRAASPGTYIAAGDPPFLIIHGTDDWFIAPHHSVDFARRLHAVHVPVTLVLVKNNGHGLAAPTQGKTQSPSPEALNSMIADFFARELGTRAHAFVASPQ